MTADRPPMPIDLSILFKEFCSIYDYLKQVWNARQFAYVAYRGIQSKVKNTSLMLYGSCVARAARRASWFLTSYIKKNNNNDILEIVSSAKHAYMHSVATHINIMAASEKLMSRQVILW